MRADLHTHSHCSDGTDSPADLIRAAAAAGLDAVALTDHDSADGWAEAARTARAVGIDFVPGMEISCELSGVGVHLLGYGCDALHPALRAELDKVLAGREARLPATLARLQSVGLDVNIDDVRRVAGPATALGRPHVADALIAAGAVSDRGEAFDRYLSPGRPAYVSRYAAPLPDMLDIVAAAGGVSVVAHPWSRDSRRVLTPDVIAELTASGLTGVEVWHQDHSPADASELRALAAELGLVATGSSDYHGTGKVDHALGCHTTPPAELDRLQAAMSTAAEAAR